MRVPRTCAHPGLRIFFNRDTDWGIRSLFNRRSPIKKVARGALRLKTLASAQFPLGPVLMRSPPFVLQWPPSFRRSGRKVVILFRGRGNVIGNGVRAEGAT